MRCVEDGFLTRKSVQEIIQLCRKAPLLFGVCGRRRRVLQGRNVTVMISGFEVKGEWRRKMDAGLTNIAAILMRPECAVILYTATQTGELTAGEKSHAIAGDNEKTEKEKEINKK